MIFYLGTHRPQWLASANVPLFVSHLRLMGRKTLPRATAPWALDSGGFSELSMHGRWTIGPTDYVADVRRYWDEIGSMQWAAIQDWMCEPAVIHGGPIAGRTAPGTQLSVAEHQARTVASYEALQELAPDLPWAPVLQGWDRSDYLRHLDLYLSRGHDLRRAPIVGLGSVCRRQATGEAESLIRELHAHGLRLHGFGFKVGAFERGVHRFLSSSDSMAWSFAARKSPPLTECTGHKNCANCMRYALTWREHVMGLTARQWPQMELFA